MSGFENLQQKLVQAKAVMDRVDGTPSNMKNVQRNVSESSNPNLPPISNNFNSQSIDNVIQSNTNMTRPKITEDRVRSSNLPDAIKKLMIDHPIPEVSFGNQIPDSLIEGAAKKMKSLSGVGSGGSNETITNNSTNNSSIKQPNKSQKLTQTGLKSLIRETIKDSLGDLIDEAISERLTKSSKINESIKIVVGGSVFEGRISSTKKLN
tara:strand:- start:2104 stop:2727 length:624 start_codon:yes stop_codon:yes gene_type:complete